MDSSPVFELDACSEFSLINYMKTDFIAKFFSSYQVTPSQMLFLLIETFFLFFPCTTASQLHSSLSYFERHFLRHPSPTSNTSLISLLYIFIRMCAPFYSPPSKFSWGLKVTLLFTKILFSFTFHYLI